MPYSVIDPQAGGWPAKVSFAFSPNTFAQNKFKDDYKITLSSFKPMKEDILNIFFVLHVGDTTARMIL